MADTLATLHALCNNTVNRLHNGDFIDLTSEGDDVVLLDGSNGEDEVPRPIGTNRTPQVSGFILKKQDPGNISTKQFLVPSKASGGGGKKLVSAPDSPGPKRDVVTITLLPNTSERTASVLSSALHKASKKTKGATNQQAVATSKNNTPRAKSATPKKLRVNKTMNAPSGPPSNIRIKNCALIPSSSEVGNQTTKAKPMSPEKVAKGPSNNPVYYLVSPKGSILAASKSPILAPKSPILASKSPTQLPQKPLQTKVTSPTAPMKSGAPINVIKQSQLATILDKNTIMRLQKNVQNNVLFLTPTKSVPLKTSAVQNPNSISPSLISKPAAKSYTRSNKEITTNIQHVQVIEDEVSTLPQEESQRIDVPSNFLINNEKDDVVGLFVYPFPENGPSSLTIPQPNDGYDELVDTQIMEIVEDEDEVIESHEEVSQTIEIKDEPEDDPQIIETIEDDEEEVIIESKERILMESGKNDPLDDVMVEPPSLVTPVDIEKILNEAVPKVKPVEDRCKYNYMKNQMYIYRGFTRREMRRPACYKYLQTLIKSNDTKIQELKKSLASYDENFIHCGGTLNNFLPEVSKCEDYDSDEYTIEYSSIDTEIQSLQIPNVISQVNEQVKALETKRTVNKKTSEAVKSTLTEPEEALKLIKKGLELIRVWKDKANKSLPVISTRKSVPVEATKRRAKSIDPKPVTVPSPPATAAKTRGRKKVEVSTLQETPEPIKRRRKPQKQIDDEPVATEVVKRKRKPKTQLVEEPAIKKQATTDNRSKVQTVRAVKAATNVETKPTRRGRKKQTVEYNDPDPNDNELFLVKKVDILNDKRKRRK